MRNKNMKLKVCGMRDAANIKDLVELSPDYIGFIFYDRSPRFVESVPEVDIPKSIQKVGVFVNASVDYIEEKAAEFGLDLIQLHGDENPEFCGTLKAKGLKIIKAFGVNDRFEFSITEHYKTVCDYFLFDTKSEKRGGTGAKFNWNLLNKYDNVLPFFLSGGIDLNNTAFIREISKGSMNIHAIDVNSRFELEPALKDIDKIKSLQLELKKTFELETS